MTALAFDTHEFVKELKGAGFSELQAEVITKLQKAAITTTLEQARHDYHLDELATRRDLKDMELALKRDIEQLRLESKKDIEQLRLELKTDMEQLRLEIKKDIELLRLETKKDIEVLRSDTKAQISEAKAELIRWVVGVGLLQTTLITGVLLKLVHVL